MGLERLCMILFEIPDVRLFWSTDERFSSQFKEGYISKFRSFSKYPQIVRDMSFWIPDGFAHNFMMEIIREVANDTVEEVKLVGLNAGASTSAD